MKNRSYANRGQTFEAFIRYANDRYAQKGIAVIEKIPTEFIPIRNNTGKIVSCKVEKKSSVDFIGRYKQYPISIEAKNTNTDSIRFDRVEEHQADFMDNFTAGGNAIGFVLLSFDMHRFFSVPWAYWSTAIQYRVRENNRKETILVRPSTIPDAPQWEIPKKVSVRADELLPAWEISGHDYDFGLHYLKNAEQYINMQARF